MNSIAIIDIGKTNSKLSLVDASNGVVIESNSRESPALDTKPYPHLDTEGLWQWYQAELERMNRIRPIEHICVTAHGAAAALINDEGLVLPVIDYEFAGPDELAADYDKICDPFTHTYSPKLPHGMNVGRQLYWQRARFPDEFAKARYLVGYPQYWTWLLSGKAAGEVTSIGAHSDLWNPVDAKFSDFACREGFDALVPEILRADEVIGRLRPEISARTGIAADCRVHVGIHDSNASLLPYLKTRATPFTVVSTGTWVISFAVGASLDGLVADRDCIANVNMYGQAVACTRYMGGREFAAVAGDEIVAVTLAGLEQIIDEEIFALPGFNEEGGPFPGLAGRIIADRQLSAAESSALASIYCALVTDVCLGLCGSLGDIIIEGAYAKNQVLMQTLATLREDQSLFASTDSTGTTMGTAMLATENIPPPDLLKLDPIEPRLQQKIHQYRTRWQSLVAEHERTSKVSAGSAGESTSNSTVISN